MDISTKAQILSDAMPYIQKYYDKIVVVKYGGNAMLNEELKNAVMRDIVMLSLIGVKVVLVHGGGPEISDMLKRVGKESKFIGGLRYTDEETAEIVQMVLAGKINKNLVGMLTRHGGKALGFCGIDGNMLEVSKKTEDGVDYGYVGEGASKVAIYRGKEPVMRSVPQEKAIEALLELISSDGKFGS